MLICNNLKNIPLNSVPLSIFSYNEFLSEQDKNYFRNYKYFEQSRPDAAFISNTYSLFDCEDLFLLKEKFNSAVRSFVENVLYAPDLQFRLVGSWCTKNVKGTYHPKHSHANAMISVVTYFEDSIQPDGEISSLLFHKDTFSNIFPNFLFSFIGTKISSWNIFNYETYAIKVKLNDVIVFPGHLEHSSEICDNDSRFCIGANYFITGEFGNNERKSLITL